MEYRNATGPEDLDSKVESRKSGAWLVAVPFPLLKNWWYVMFSCAFFRESITTGNMCGFDLFLFFLFFREA